MASFLSEKTILRVLDRAYVQALEGMPGVQSANDLAQQFSAREGTLEERVNALVRWQMAKAATSGFVSGLGGLITMPVSIPANISVVLFVQIRMIAAIAIMSGHDVKDDRIKSLVYACMAWNAAKKILLDIGVDVTTRLALRAIARIPDKALATINQQVGFSLLTKFGEKGVVHLGKAAPLAGAMVGATFEAVSTNAVGSVAREVFCSDVAQTALQVPPTGPGQDIEDR